MPLHSFCIGFSDSSCCSTSTSRRTSLPTQFHPHSIDSRSHMLNRSKLNLKSSFTSLCMFLKNLQNQINPISSNHLFFEILFLTDQTQLFIDRINLSRLQSISNHKQIRLQAKHIFYNFLKLPFSNIGSQIWLIFFLILLQDYNSSISIH